MGGTKKQIGTILTQKGATFRVWAPFANEVALVGSFNDWQPTPMENENDGYWFVEIPHAEAGQEYKFQIKNGENIYTRNDPRALHLTTSGGSSVIVETDFDWEGDSFVAPPVNEQVIYELHIGTFYRTDPATTGTFDDASEKLDHLASLGVNMIEIMPIATMSMDRGWGYAPDYIYSVESLYGGRQQFLNFVKLAHQKGIGVILDVVYNHIGPDSNLDLWQFDGWNKDGMGGIYFYNDWRAETPWGTTRPDYGRPEVQQYILDNVAMWVHDCRLDGLRLDSTIYIRNVNGINDSPNTDIPEAWGLIQRINTIATKINSKAIVIAEDVADNEYITKPVDQGGAGFSAQWELGFPNALREALYQDNINLTGICAQLGRRFNDDPFHRVIYSDSHDTAANGGARLNENILPGKADSLIARKKLLIANTILLTSPGIPMIFQGQEFMESGAFTDWNTLDWENAEKFRGITEAHKHLIALRKNISKVSAGLIASNINLSHVDENNKVIAYHRWKNGGAKDDVVVIVNFGSTNHQEYYLGFPRNGVWRVRFNSSWQGYNPDNKASKVQDVVVDSGSGSISLPPYCALILSQDD